MLNTTRSPNEPVPSKNNGNKSASSKNDNSRQASKRNDGNNKIDGFGSIKHVKKSGKLKDKKLAKPQKLSRSGKSKSKKSKKLSKSGNSPNFYAKNSGPSFLIPEARLAFNCLWLAFTKAPIL